MNLGDYLSPSCIATRVGVKSKDDVLRKITELLVTSEILERQNVAPEEVLSALQRREEMQSTNLGNGLAIPHARIPGFKGIAMVLLTLSPPILFDDAKNEPVRIVWAILVAEDQPTLALQAYAKINELMQDPAIRVYFDSIEDPAILYDYIRTRRIPVGGSLTARDIMRPPITHILPDMPLREVVRQMRIHRIEAVPVEDASRHVLGEITCDRLFQFGIPDFFNQLQNVAFIRHFDPFQRYFSEEARSTARDVMQPNFRTVEPDATILEVVYALTVEKHPKLYVVDEGRRIGSIDRIEVLDRILDF